MVEVRDVAHLAPGEDLGELRPIVGQSADQRVDVRIRDEAIVSPVELHAQPTVRKHAGRRKAGPDFQPRAGDGMLKIGRTQLVAQDARLDKARLPSDVLFRLFHLTVAHVPEQAAAGRRDDRGGRNGEAEMEAGRIGHRWDSVLT